jgi:polysaccharide biosynthesis transport protein
MRKPRQHQAFEVNPEQGLATVLADRRPVEEAILKTAVAGLDLLPCGPLPSNPVELLNNGFLEEMLITLRGKYDRVVIDSPPVIPVADARVLATMADCTLLVLRAERTTRRVALAARNELWQVRVKRLGVIVNAVPQRRSAAYGYGGYGGEYGGYGEKPYSYSEEVLEQPRRKSRSLPSPKPAAASTATEASEI